MDVKRRFVARHRHAALWLPLPAAGLTLVVVASSCAQGLDHDPAPLFKGHQALTGGSGTKRTGQDCTTFGASDCASGICLHTHPEPSAGYFCTTRCDPSLGNDNCSPGFACIQIYPISTGFVCVPNRNWGGQGAGAPVTPFLVDGGQP